MVFSAVFVYLIIITRSLSLTAQWRSWGPMEHTLNYLWHVSKTLESYALGCTGETLFS